MQNFIVSYDLNGPSPSHRQIDTVLANLGGRRILESVWHVRFAGDATGLRNYLLFFLGREDRLVVCKSDQSAWHNLLVTDRSMKEGWEKQGGLHNFLQG